jgi:hypothetical protein
LIHKREENANKSTKHYWAYARTSVKCYMYSTCMCTVIKTSTTAPPWHPQQKCTHHLQQQQSQCQSTNSSCTWSLGISKSRTDFRACCWTRFSAMAPPSSPPSSLSSRFGRGRKTLQASLLELCQCSAFFWTGACPHQTSLAFHGAAAPRRWHSRGCGRSVTPPCVCQVLGFAYGVPLTKDLDWRLLSTRRR